MMKPEVIKIRSKRPKQSQWFGEDSEIKGKGNKPKDQYKRKPKHNKRDW